MYGHPNVPRPHPRIDERRYDPEERTAYRIGLVVGLALAVLIIVAVAS